MAVSKKGLWLIFYITAVSVAIFERVWGMALLGVLLHEVVQKNRLYFVLLPKLHDNDKYFYNNITNTLTGALV